MSQAPGDAGKSAARPGWLRRYLPLAVLLAVSAFAVSQGWHNYLSLRHIAENREMLRALVDANLALALIAYMGLYVAVVALSLPGGALLTITGGFLFGWLAGGLATVVAATLGATLIFLVARTSLGETLAERAGPRLKKLSEGFRKDALNYLLFLRLVPAFPFWLVNLAPALLGVSLPVYVLGTFLGIIPGTFAFAFLGAGLDSLIEAQRAAFEACKAARGAEGTGECTFTLDPASLLTPELVAAFVALGVVALIPVAIRRLRVRNGRQRPHADAVRPPSRRSSSDAGHDDQP